MAVLKAERLMAVGCRAVCDGAPRAAIGTTQGVPPHTTRRPVPKRVRGARGRRAIRMAAGLAAGCLLCSAALAQVTVQASRVTLGISESGTWQTLIHRGDGRECCRTEDPTRLCDIQIAGKTHQVARVTETEAGMAISFEGTDTVLQIAIEPTEDWVLFRLAEIEGTRPDRVTLLRVPCAVDQRLGRRLNCGWDGRTAVCVMAGNRQTDCGASGKALLQAASQDAPGPRLEGAACALIVCPTPEFKAIARKASHAFGLQTNEAPDGTPVKDTDLVRGSYFFFSLAEESVDTAIEYCKRTGIRQIMLSSGAWCRSVGHYLFSESRYPHGIEGLKGLVDKLHANGILVGMHTFVSKINKVDPYVTPVPDKRFWRKFETRLAEDVSAEQTEIKVDAGMNLKAWAGSSETRTKYWEGGVDKHREVVIGDEIIQYERVGPDGAWDTFIGCKRGAWGTTPAAHKAGDDAVHFGVDGCINGYIIDQETDLMGEVAERIAGIFNTCGFDMVYFDGGEDVDTRRFNYYVSNFQAQAVQRFTKRPIIHMGTCMTHLLWHSFARSSTVDTYLATLGGAIIGGRGPEQWPTVKDHINTSVRYMLSVSDDMMPGELGWFGIWSKGTRGYTKELTDKEFEKYRAEGMEEGDARSHETECALTKSELLPGKQMKVSVEYDGLQLDEAEYLMCKSLAHDAAVSLQTGFSEMEAHPLTPEILHIFRTYEELRMARAVPPADCARVAPLNRDFAMVNLDGKRDFAEVSRVRLPGGRRDYRAMCGAYGEGSIATLWHAVRDARITLSIDPARVRLVSFAGEPLEFGRQDGKVVIGLDQTRKTLICPTLSPERLREALESADLWERPPTLIDIPATAAAKLVGKMAFGSQVGVTDPGAENDVLICTGAPSFSKANDWYAEYTVDIPREGLWTVWARVRYPTGGDMSFGIVREGEEVTLGYDQVLGNCGLNEGQWHWTGRGGGSTAPVPGVPIRFKLDKGPFTFRIYGREGGGNAAVNPRLDKLCLSDEPTFMPQD